MEAFLKIGILVKSPLLERTLQLYLREYLVNVDECDFVITDEIDESQRKPICLINFSEDSDILRPIYKESLMSDLARFSTKLREMRDSLGDDIETMNIKNVLDFGELERLRQSIEMINGADSADSNVGQTHTARTKERSIKDKIDIIVQDFADKLYETIKNGQ